MPAHNLTAQEQLVEIKQEFDYEGANLRLERRTEQRAEIITYVNALLDAYLDMWPELIEEPSGAN